MKTFIQLLKEMSSLSRVNSHVKTPSMSFGVISAMKGFDADALEHQGLSVDELKSVKDKHHARNEEKHIELKKQVRSMNYGYIEHDGLWTNAKGVAGYEKSLLVPHISTDELIALGSHHNQEAVIHKSGTNFTMIDVASGKGIMDFQHGKDKNLDLAAASTRDYWSRLRYGSHSDKKYVFIPKDTENSQ